MLHIKILKNSTEMFQLLIKDMFIQKNTLLRPYCGSELRCTKYSTQVHSQQTQNICTTAAQRLRRRSNIVQML